MRFRRGVGGLGVLGAGFMDVDQLREELSWKANDWLELRGGIDHALSTWRAEFLTSLPSGTRSEAIDDEVPAKREANYEAAVEAFGRLDVVFNNAGFNAPHHPLDQTDDDGVTLRQRLDLFACVRPVRYFQGVPSPVRTPEKMDMIVFRENTEDIYAGMEVEAGTPEAKRMIELCNIAHVFAVLMSLVERLETRIGRDRGMRLMKPHAAEESLMGREGVQPRARLIHDDLAGIPCDFPDWYAVP